MGGGEEDVRINPHQVIVIDFSIERFLMFSASQVRAQAHVAGKVDVAGIPSAEDRGDAMAKAPCQQFRPAFQEFSRKAIAGKAKDHSQRFSGHWLLLSVRRYILLSALPLSMPES